MKGVSRLAVHVRIYDATGLNRGFQNGSRKGRQERKGSEAELPLRQGEAEERMLPRGTR